MKLIEVLSFHTGRDPQEVGVLMLNMVEISHGNIHCADRTNATGGEIESQKLLC